MTTGRWTILPASAFEEHRGAWDEINRSSGNHVLLDSRFVAGLLEHFGSAGTRLAVSGTTRPTGIALLERRAAGWWETLQPSQAPLGLLLIDRGAAPLAQLDGLIRSLPGYALSLGVRQQDPDFSSVSDVGTEPHRVERLPYIDTPRLPIIGTFAEYWASRSSNLTHNLARQRRRLTEQGARLELVVERSAEQMPDAVKAYGELESAGWKAEGGTAIAVDNRQGAFYREMLQAFCRERAAVVYRLLLDGRTIACNLCLERDGMLLILKTTYDESMPKLSPGLLLHESMLQQLFSEQRVKVLEYYGPVRDWHRKWTGEIRTMYHLTIYRHRMIGAGRALAKSVEPRLRAAIAAVRR